VAQSRGVLSLTKRIVAIFFSLGRDVASRRVRLCETEETFFASSIIGHWQ